MILSGQTRCRIGRIAGLFLLLSTVAVLPLAAVVRGDDERDKKRAAEQVRDAILRRVAQMDELHDMRLLLASKQAEVKKLTTDIAGIERRIEKLNREAIRDAILSAAGRAIDQLSPRQGNKQKDRRDPPTDDRGAAKGSLDDRVQLHGKWIVRAVKVDGKATPAQIGREVGDVITIKKHGEHLALS